MAQLTVRGSNSRGASSPAAGALTARPNRAPVPLTPTQMWTWNDVVQRKSGLSRARLCAESVRLTGKLHIGVLERSIEILLHRHESLRTRIIDRDGAPVQAVEPPPEFALPVDDLTGVDAGCRERSARDMAEAFIDEEVDLSSPRIFEARLLKLSDLDHVLVVGVDHIIADAASCAILSQELWETYRDVLRAEPSSLTPLTLQFPDYAAWHHAGHSSWMQQHLPYWEDKLGNAPALRIPHDYQPEGVEEPVAAVLHVPFGKHLTTRLRDSATSAGIRFPLAVLGLYCAQIFLRDARSDVLVTFLSHGRNAHPELRSMIGELAHCIYLRVEVDPSESLCDLVNRTAAEFNDANTRDASHLPPRPGLEFPTDYYFNWFPAAWIRARDRSRSARPDPGGVIRQPFPLTSRKPVDFAPLFYNGPSGLVMTLLYRSDLFKQLSMRRYGTDLKWLAMKFVENPRCPLGSVVLPE